MLTNKNILSFILLALLVVSAGVAALAATRAGDDAAGEVVFHVSPSGDDDADGLTPESSFRTLERARDQIRKIHRGESGRRCRAADGRPAQMVPCWPEYNHVQTTPEGPGNNALGSGLFGKLSRGKHAKMLTDAEKRVLATWIDLNATFYGCYEEPNLSRQLRGEPIHMLERQ